MSTRACRRVRQIVLERDEHVCRYCGALASHVDHIRLRRLGGTDSPVNLVAACARCNLRKRGKALRGGRSDHGPPARTPSPGPDFHPRCVHAVSVNV